ncbi:hypothetical protein FA13DRAFT_58031 [Coprinellus micaceus]|uniref:Uncharacterized protein n=1 Tax=Coprinellus micaceus TaxID=71717 RepID=A0A4Y7U154_COPMI|nr:hypothetical protein FA13DRAFT_58031 [Coprinellus micaceus]
MAQVSRLVGRHSSWDPRRALPANFAVMMDAPVRPFTTTFPTQYGHARYPYDPQGFRALRTILSAKERSKLFAWDLVPKIRIRIRTLDLLDRRHLTDQDEELSQFYACRLPHPPSKTSALPSFRISEASIGPSQSEKQA